MPFVLNAPKLCPAVPLNFICIVSSGKPSALYNFVISLDKMVPTVLFVFLILNVAKDFSLFSKDDFAAAINFQSNTFSISWSCFSTL